MGHLDGWSRFGGELPLPTQNSARVPGRRSSEYVFMWVGTLPYTFPSSPVRQFSWVGTRSCAEKLLKPRADGRPRWRRALFVSGSSRTSSEWFPWQGIHWSVLGASLAHRPLPRLNARVCCRCRCRFRGRIQSNYTTSVLGWLQPPVMANAPMPRHSVRRALSLTVPQTLFCLLMM